jgi:diacylglycerol kinase family enzyme
MNGWKPVEPSRHPVLLVNPRSGGGRAYRAGLVNDARARGIDVRVLDSDRTLEGAARDTVAAGADALGVAGGDGSLAVVAAIARDHDLPFVCIPAGTRNHFALDIGVDRSDLPGSLDAFTDGVERRIDVGEVNGRMFLNNVSLGVYGDAVHRPAYRDAKARTLLETAASVIGSHDAAPHLELVDDDGTRHADPALVLVSNNPYALDQPVVTGTRPALDGGQLGVLVLDAPHHEASRPGRAWTALCVAVTGPAEPLHAAIDGEPVDLTPPLRFAIRPMSLRARISSRHPGVSPSARLPDPLRRWAVSGVHAPD